MFKKLTSRFRFEPQKQNPGSILGQNVVSRDYQSIYEYKIQFCEHQTHSKFENTEYGFLNLSIWSQPQCNVGGAALCFSSRCYSHNQALKGMNI